ncbi:PREDICTED: gasdermin-A3-like [Ficedula albicollis]|uniref:gasdermin-A3-like n=1 Tax=Ficedula albicollis TaxID=59894 RepID=UPI0007AD79D5|nr:PREDICTED: gasdermin-A3-like [Ficedula albicollis]
MFKKFTKVIAKEMDPSKDLVPVESITDNEHFRPLSLLKKKRKSKTMFHPAPYYQRTGFTLHDVLLPGEDGKGIEALLQVSSQFTITKTSKDQVDGGLSISFDPATVDLKGGASLSKAFSVKSQKRSISLQSLEALKKEREMNMNHSFIRQLQRTDIDLYVVTEILEASEETVYKESTKADGGFKATFLATFFAKGNRESNQDIVIPKGCTLAFRTIPLIIRDGEWDVGYLPTERTKMETIGGFLFSFRCGLFANRTNDDGNNRRTHVTELVPFWFAGPSQGKLGEVVGEVEYRCHIFSKLSPDVLLIIFNAIKAVMKDKNLLQELRQKMEDIPEQNDGYELKTESPHLKDLFSTLQHSPRDCLLQVAGGITYVLDALHELMDDQLLLLLESLERKILSQQLNLVAEILKHDLEDKMCNFHVDARLFSFPHEEEQRLTMELVELSGVQLQEDGSAVPRDQPFESVAALFVAVYFLNGLSRVYLALSSEILSKASGNLC